MKALVKSRAERGLWLEDVPEPQIGINDFPPAFLFVGLLSASAVFIFMRLPPDAGAELAGRKSEAAE